MKKRILAVLLCLCMVLTMLPVSALAAVGGLLNNAPEQNETLLEKLQSFTGESPEEALALLDSMGLLDEDGNLITDQTIDLDGKQYTLEEMEALLEDPSADLSQVAYADGVPIALGDLKTVIAIERELQHLQETYFSGKTFDGEARENLNSLVTQLQTAGIAFQSAAVGDTHANVPSVNVNNFTAADVDSGEQTLSIPARANQEYSVTVTLDPGLLEGITVNVTLGATMTGVTQSVTAQLSESDPTATLTYTATLNDQSVYKGVPLTVNVSSSTPDVPDYAYGELAGAVHFSNAQGFVFESGGQQSDSHTLRLTKTVDVPDLSTKWMQAEWTSPLSLYSDTVENQNNHKSADVYFEFLTEVSSSSNEALGITNDKPTATIETINEFIGFLQGAKGYTSVDAVGDDVVKFSLTVGNLSARCNSTITARAWNYEGSSQGYTPNMYFLPEGGEEGVDRVDLKTINYGMDYSSEDINVNNIDQITTSLQFEASTKLGTNAVPERLEVRGGIFYPGAGYGAEVYNYGMLRDTAVELINDGKAPTLKSATTPSGTYRPGQLVPVVLTFDELVYVKDDAKITINDKEFTPNDLHMSKAGNQLMFWYPVQKVDGKQVTITSLTGITDIFGNAAEIIGEPASGATLESARMRDAATGLSAAYENGQATVTVTLSEEEAYKNKYAGYHQNASGEAQEVPFQAVVTDGNGKVTEIQQVYVNEDGFATQPFAVAAQNDAMTYTVTLQANEGTREDPNWVDLSYNTALQDSFSVSALVQAATVTVTDNSGGDYELSLADTVRPTLKATVYGPDGSTLASSQSGTWSSSDTAIATITTEDDYSGKVTLTGRKVGEVTFTFTADNGTPDDDSDDKTGKSQTYTVVAGESIALVIPQGASTIVVRQKAAATVLWSSNASQFAPGADFQYTIEVFYGNYKTEAELEGKTAVQTYTAAKDQNSVLIPENVLSQLSSGETPAYTVRVSMPHPNGSGEDVRLSALAWIVVHPEPATAVLTRPESLYLKDDEGPVEIGWSLENYTRQTATLTILRVTEDSTSEKVCNETLSSGSGTYTLNLSQVAEGNLKDTYQVMLSVTNPGEESPSTDSFPLYVYNADALQIVNSEDEEIDSLTLDNTEKVQDLTAENNETVASKTTQEILSMRQELGLLDYIGINYGAYDWNSFKDGIQWATDNEEISVNYKQGGLYEDIQLFDFDTYLPELKMGIATVEGGEATITATHAATDMKASIKVTADTLRDQFYLFQVTPAVKTTLRYTNGDDEEQTVTTNSEGVLALYEPSGIASDVWLNSEVTEDGEITEYLGTIYNYDLQSGEGDARKLQLYPLNTFRLREAAKAELTLVKPDGSPLAGSEVIVRGGVYKNGYFCETAGLGTTRNDIGAAGEEQQDTEFTTDENGKLTVYFDFTQFWSEEAGETKDSLPTAEDKIQYVLEVRDIADDAYYPLFQMVDGTVSPMQEMRTASGVVVLEKVPQGEANKPFVARQVIDYDLEDGTLIDTRYSTGFVGPNYNFQEAVLTTDMLLWGESGDGASYSLTMVDENDYSPEAQVPTGAERYPFTSMPVVENTLTLTEETMTTSGWIPDGEDVGLKTRLTQDGALVQERTMPFRAIDLTDVKSVEEDENVTGMVATLMDSSGWDTNNINFGNGGSSILDTLMGDLGKLTGPVNTSVFQMLITPSEDPSVFNALIWAGYDSLDLKDVEYKNGVAVSANFMTKGLETDMPSVGDLQQMANGTYDPMAAYDPYQSNRLSDVAGFDFGVQLEGYYEAEIRYNRTSGDWEVYTKGGGFTAGVGMEFGFNVNTVVGIVPVTGSFEVGGAMQLSLQAATRYSEQEGLEWSDSEATAVTDFLTELRLRAYVEAFGGFGFDYSLIALKIGLFGKLDVNSQNRFLSREYLAEEAQRQTNGQYLDIQSEVGIKFKAVFALISYEKVLASGSFGYGKPFNDWNEIDSYWENTGTGLDSQSRQYAAAASGLREVSSTATLQSRDYLEQYARTWGNTQARMSLFSLDEKNGVKNLQTNANPASFPELSDDGKVLAYISDGNSDSIYDSRAHYSLLNDDGSYGTSQEFPDGGFEGYGDSDVDIAGVLKTDYTGGNATAAAAWVRQSAQIPGKDAGAEITAEEQNLLMNSSEIMVSVWSKRQGYYDNGSWTTTRLTTNATPDLAPAVAVNGKGNAIVFWRSVYSADPEGGLMDFSSQDQIMYSYYDGTWSEPKMLYNGANGSVKGLQAAMLNDGTAMAVYTLDRNTEASDGSGQEIGYTIVKSDGSLGTSMLVTSDKTLDENPQVAALSLHLTSGMSDQRFILGWHSQREGVSDIQLLAVDENGVMSNTFPASLSALTSSGQANIGGDFRFARVWTSRTSGSGYVDNLTILWSETVSDETTNRLMTAAHSQLKAVRLLAEDTDDDYIVDDFWLTAPQVVAELPENTLLDHFDAYVETSYADNSQHPIKAVIQATYYDQTNPETIPSDEGTVTLPGEETKLYTATHNFEAYGLEVEAIGVDYANLMAESLTPIQFTVRNTGVNEVTDLTVTLEEEEETATLEEALAPNESATLTVYHGIDEAVSNVKYTIAGNNITDQSGTVYLNYPDIGISQMKVLEENEGKRTIAVTLYNTSDAPLADSGRTVKVGFYTDSMLEEEASVTYNGSTTSDAITISGNDLARIDAGSYTLVLTYDVGSYVKDTLCEKEIPESGVYLYADAWAEGTIGTQSGSKRLPEYHSGDNQSAVLLTGAYARTGEMTALDVVLDNSDDTTTATVTLKNNSLQDQADSGTLVALLLDENGNTLDTHTVTEDTKLTCEQNKQIPVDFQEKGTDVILLYVPAGSTETQLQFSNIDVDLSDFVEEDPDKSNEYTYTLQGDAPASTTVIFSSSEKVTINGEEQSTGVGSVQVPIPTGSSTITVTMGEKTYHLHLTRSGGGGGETTYPPTILETEHGTVTVDPTHPRQGDTVTITAQPDEGYEVGEVTVTRPDGSQVELTENSDGIWGFTQPGESVTIAVTFRCDGGELCPSAHLTDVELNAWYHEAVDYVVEHGIMAGVSATAFQPNGSLTRGQVVQILHNLEGKPEETAEAPFTDTAGHWALEAIAWAAQNNVVAGYDDGTFGPEKLVTREEFAQMMYNYAKFKGYDLTAGGDLTQFPDAGAISDWAETALSWANGKGLINGHDNGTIDPQGNTTRAQAASIMKNFDLKVVED
ncbi:S-layer homology domain-containing protein [Acutalibacter sp. LFL-21]|uniref:S-layer homology domain-containing protein n=1 Tax=Acutalibacter sp. LFL-21 TaxID=2983399 RepID=UPI0021D66BE4|nr:S-layer homology domain-containing protein [Acutalibacter sp. LFL-21]MCU7652029.1 S-layer homology domain-containing protein [Acutalibacter sp. LFL-21]